MNKIYLISYFYRPLNEIATVRVSKMSKYLVLRGYSVCVITSKNRNYSKIKDNTTNVGDIEILEEKCFDGLYIKYYKDLKNQSDKSQDFYVSPSRKLFKKFINKLVFKILPLGNITWYWNIKSKIKKLNIDETDIIISTYSPLTSHKIAKYIKSNYGCKWIADFRDLYAFNHYITNSKVKNIIKCYRQKIILRECDQIITVSEALAEQLKKTI